MSDSHLTRALLDSLSNGQLAPGEILDSLLEHIRSCCPACDKEAQAWLRLKRPQAENVTAYASALSSVLDAFVGRSGEFLQAEKDAREAGSALLELALEESAPVGRTQTERLRDHTEISVLLGEALRLAPLDGKRCLAVSRLARRLASEKWALFGQSEDNLTDLLVQSVAFEANAHRVQGQLRTSCRDIAFARQIMNIHGVCDPEVVASVDRIEAKILEAHGSFAKAEVLYKRALAQLASIGSELEHKRVSLSLAVLYQNWGRLERAVDEVRRLLRGLDPEQDRRLFFFAQHNMADWLSRLGEIQEARTIFDSCLSFYEEFPEEPIQIRRVWLAALLERGYGRKQSAILLYSEVQQRFLAIESPIDAAVAALEEASLHLELGDTARVRSLAQMLVPIFQEKETHHEALAAMILFEQAAKMERASEQMIQQLSRFLNHSRQNPQLRFSWQQD